MPLARIEFMQRYEILGIISALSFINISAALTCHFLSDRQTALCRLPPKMTDRMGSPPAIEDQARLLEDALIMVRQQTNQMRKCLETPGKLMDALKCR